MSWLLSCPRLTKEKGRLTFVNSNPVSISFLQNSVFAYLPSLNGGKMGLFTLTVVLHFVILLLILRYLSIIQDTVHKAQVLNIETHALLDILRYQINAIERHTVHRTTQDSLPPEESAEQDTQ